MIYRFEFVEGTDMKQVEDTVSLAILAAGCMCGEARIRLCVSYACSHEKRSVVIQAIDDGESVLMLFVGFCSHEYGSESFKVARLSEHPDLEKP